MHTVTYVLEDRKNHRERQRTREIRAYGDVWRIVKHYPLRGHCRNKATGNPGGIYTDRVNVSMSVCVCVCARA